MGGLTAGIIALPLALAFGVASGLGASAGLYGAIATGILAALFGGTPGQITGPTGPMTVVAAAVIAEHSGRPELIFGAIVLAGIFQILAGYFKVGGLIQYIPYPVVSGFMTGIGVIIIFLEITPLFGLETYADVEESLLHYMEIPSKMNIEATIISFLTIGIIYLFPRITKKIPPPLVALVTCSLLSVFMDMDVPRIGEIPQGFPMPTIPAVGVHEIHLLLIAGVSLAVLGSLDSLLTSLVMDRMTGKRHNSDLELFGQGLGNIASGLIGGLPGAGATMRSLVNIKSGGSGYLSGVIHGAVLLVILLSLGTLAAQIPLACLAGILITVGISIIDYRGLKAIKSAPRSDVVVMLLVVILTVFVDLMIAVLLGITLASILFTKKVADYHLSSYKAFDSLDHLEEDIKDIPIEIQKKVFVYEFKGPLFFGEVKNFNKAIPSFHNIECLILKFVDVPIVDQSGAYAIEDLVTQLRAKGVKVLIVGLEGRVRETLEKLGTLKKILHGNNEYTNIKGALSEVKQLTEKDFTTRA